MCRFWLGIVSGVEDYLRDGENAIALKSDAANASCGVRAVGPRSSGTDLETIGAGAKDGRGKLSVESDGAGNGNSLWNLGKLRTGNALTDRVLLLVDETNHCIVVQAPDGRVMVHGRKGTAAGEFHYPRSILVLGSAAYVVDSWNHRVQVFDLPSWKFQFEFGKFGHGPGQFFCPEFDRVCRSVAHRCRHEQCPAFVSCRRWPVFVFLRIPMTRFPRKVRGADRWIEVQYENGRVGTSGVRLAARDLLIMMNFLNIFSPTEILGAGTSEIYDRLFPEFLRWRRHSGFDENCPLPRRLAQVFRMASLMAAKTFWTWAVAEESWFMKPPGWGCYAVGIDYSSV